MEYKKSDADAWTAGTGNDMTGLVPGTYYVRVKAAGGIRDYETAMAMIEAGAERLGTSAGVELMQH